MEKIPMKTVASLTVFFVLANKHNNHVEASNGLTADGLKFSIDQGEEFQHKKFKIAGHELPDTWGFVDEKYIPLDHTGYDEMMSKCDLEANAMPMHAYGKLSTVNYYRSSADFNKYKGTDMVPENKDNYVRGSFFANNLNFKDKKSVYEEDIMMKQCKVDNGDGSQWTVQRVGPFISTGGYDWWQVGWSDAGGFEEILKQHPEGIDVESTILVPVHDDGTRLGHPPIHIHHIHFVAQQGVRFRNIIRGFCLSSSGTTSYTVDSYIKEKNCYNSSLYFEQHGDYQCRPEDDGIECLTVNSPANPRRISHPIDIEGELNDVRPFDSAPIRWNYQIALKWRPIQPEKKAMSQMTIMAPGDAKLGHQLSRVMTFPTPTDAPRFIYYTGHFWANGEMVRNKLHAHNLVFESSSFFLATLEDLGLNQPRYHLDFAYAPKKVTDMGFASNDDVQNEILANLKKSQDRFDEKCGVNGNDPAHDVCSRPRPYWACSAVYDANEFEFGNPPKMFSMDRRPLTWCKPLNFKKDEQFVVIAFSRKLTRPPVTPFPDTIPPTIPGHVSWHFWYFHEDWHHSFFGRIVCNQEGIFFNAASQYGLFDVGSVLGSVLLEGGIPKGFFTRYFFKYLIMTVFFILMFLAVYMGAKKKKD